MNEVLKALWTAVGAVDVILIGAFLFLDPHMPGSKPGTMGLWRKLGMGMLGAGMLLGMTTTFDVLSPYSSWYIALTRMGMLIYLLATFGVVAVRKLNARATDHGAATPDRLCLLRPQPSAMVSANRRRGGG